MHKRQTGKAPKLWHWVDDLICLINEKSLEVFVELLCPVYWDAYNNQT